MEPLISLLVVLIVVALIFWGLTRIMAVLPISEPIRTIVEVVIILIVIVVLLRWIGPIDLGLR